MTRRTPQEKKALSYAKDRRNRYRRNDKASRKIIPLRKAGVNRRYRRKIDDILHKITDPGDIQHIEVTTDDAAALKRDFWKKSSDTPLGEVVERKLDRRINHVGSGKTARKKVAEFLKNLKIAIEQEADGRWQAKAEIIPPRIKVYGDTREEVILRCSSIAQQLFLEELGAQRVRSIDENSISIEIY